MPDTYFFSVEIFKASDRARTVLNLQGGRRQLERLEILSGLFVGYGSRPPLMGGYLISPCFHDLRAIPLPYGPGYHIYQNFCLHFSLFDSVLLRLANVAECCLKKQASTIRTATICIPGQPPCGNGTELGAQPYSRLLNESGPSSSDKVSIYCNLPWTGIIWT